MVESKLEINILGYQHRVGFESPGERMIIHDKRREKEAGPEHISDTDSLVNKMQIRTIIAAMFGKENKNQNKTATHNSRNQWIGNASNICKLSVQEERVRYGQLEIDTRTVFLCDM